MPLFQELQDALNGSLNHQVYTSDNGQEAKKSNLIMTYDASNIYLSQYSNNKLGMRMASISIDNLKNFVHFLTTYTFTPSTYRSVKKDQNWRNLYNYSPRNVTYIYKDGVSTVTRLEVTVPCRACWVLLPEKLVSLDHQKAQSLATDDALLKVFRALGLTAGLPSGEKGQVIFLNWQAQVGGLQIRTGTGAKEDLNNPGKVYYTLFRAANKLADLRTACVHSMVNLRPVCSSCNPSLGAHL